MHMRYPSIQTIISLAAFVVLSMTLVILPLMSMSVYAGHVSDACGADNQRACCAGTFEVFLGDACDYGNVEVAGCDGSGCLCGGFNPFGIHASGTCKATVACGGENERACCGSEAPDNGGKACADGLVQVEGCTGNCLCGDSFATGQRSSGTCVRPAPCGGEGQRACCVIEPKPDGVAAGKACAAGLIEIDGCSGDCTCGDGDLLADKSTGTCVTEDWKAKRIEEPGSGWTPPADSRSCSLLGYADLHVHLNAHLAHGNEVFVGKPAPIDGVGDIDNPGVFTLTDTVNINEALSNAEDTRIHVDHAPLDSKQDAIGQGTQDGARGPGGAPVFNNWPTWRSTTHQQMYYKWLERAFRGGLRLMTMFAVTNEALCRATVASDRKEELCNDSMPAIDAQITAAYAFEAFIDEQCTNNPGSDFCVGDPEEGWFRIVKTPLEARQVISDGKLAVVLGIEVDNLFNCKKTGDCPRNLYDADGNALTTVEAAVDYYYGLGVRHLFLIHNFDNAFGGPATWQDSINLGNRVVEGAWWSTQECPQVDGKSYGFKTPSDIGSFFKNIFAAIFGFGLWEGIPDGGESASCNNDGLTPAGISLVNALMDKGMIIDIDHMSNKSIDDVLHEARLREPHYPLVASHVQFFDLNDESIRHERMRTLQQLQDIRDDGGMIAAMTKDDQQDAHNKGSKFNLAYNNPPLFGPAITDDCRHSSKTFAQAYQYSVDSMGGPVALGSDFNGVAGHVGPRFGDDACGSDLPLSVELAAAQERSAQNRANNRLQYPFTFPGFGTFAKQQTGLKTFDYNVDGLAHVGLLPDFVADLKQVGLSDTYLDALFKSAEEFIRVWERADRVAALSRGETPAPVPPQELSCPSVNLCTGVDNTPPEVICPQNAVAECAGNVTPVTFASATIVDGGCGSAIYQGCTSVSGSDFTLGETTVTCSVTDISRNAVGCDFQVIVQDTIKPSITAPLDLTGIECTSPQGASPDLGEPVTSDMCDSILTIGNDATATFPVRMTSLVSWTATDDSGNSSSDTQSIEVVDTTPPVIEFCPADIVAECTGAHAAPVTPGVATGSDICSSSVAMTGYDTRSFAMGTTSLTYTATDDQGLTASCMSNVTVQDTTPPVITHLASSPRAIWPPDHKMQDITVQVESADVCDSGLSKPACAITRISSNEPQNGRGDGNHTPDWVITGPLTAALRKERSGKGEGRVYSLEVTCTDQQGLSATGTTSVSVAHNR